MATHAAHQDTTTTANTARDMTAKLGDAASELASKAGEQVDRVINEADTTVRTIRAQGRDAGERVTEVAGNMKTAVDKSLKEQPMATLAIAAALGLVVGALWKS
jgi:ElaB/YqjD/DUF883 family membrane-anchored ribosome-binding protein